MTNAQENEVLAAAQWLHHWTTQGGFAGWLLRFVIPSSCLENFNRTLQEFTK